MIRIAYSRKNRFLLVLFFVFSCIFIASGIPGIYRESVLFGSGYYQSFTFFKTLLTFMPFVLCAIGMFLLIRKRHILIFDEKGIYDRHRIWKEVYISWNQVLSAKVGVERKRYYLYVDIKDISNVNYPKNTTDISGVMKIPLNTVDCDLKEVDEFITMKIREKV